MAKDRNGETLLGYYEKGRMTKSAATWLDKAISYVSPQRGLQRINARTRLELAYQFRGAEQSRIRADWILGTSSSTAPAMERATLRERSRDLNRNDAVASGATETLGINIVGNGLQLQSRLRAHRLGVTEERGKELQAQVEQIWTDWKPSADSSNLCDFDELQFLALRKIVEDGEIIALPIMANEKWRAIKRAVELIEADRLVNHQATLSLSSVDSAIETGDRGQPVAYWIEKAKQNPGQKSESVRIAARDDKGRPKILHLFPVRRPGQLRGVPWFSPVVTLFKDLADTIEAEVVAARVSACLAVFVTMNDPSFGALGNQTDTESSTNARIQSIEPGLVGYLRPGESINTLAPSRPGDTFAPFVEMVLRMIGSSIGLPYELLTKDFSKTNYSSARAAILEGRRMFTAWRSWFGRKFCQPLYDLVIEEAYLRGLLDVKDFYENRAEYTRAQWLGGGWGWVDPVKEVEASRKAVDYGLSTLADEAAGQGRDWEEILEQQKREQDKAASLGVVIRHAAKDAEPEKEEEKNAETEKE